MAMEDACVLAECLSASQKLPRLGYTSSIGVRAAIEDAVVGRLQCLCAQGNVSQPLAILRKFLIFRTFYFPALPREMSFIPCT